MNDTQSGAVALLKGGEYNQKENGYIYAVDSENAIIYGYEGNETVLVLPNELGGKAVTVIAANTFANLDGSRKITKVTVPVNVKSIEPSAFLGGKDYHNYDSMLTDITILGTDVEIGSMAFARHQNLRIDMTKVTNLKADLNAFSSVSKIIVSKDAQKDMRTALAENSSVNQNTKVYIDTDENNAFYWHYVNGKWVIVSSGTSSFKDEQGLIYTVNYTVEGATVAATAAITGYNKPETSTATGLVIPKTLPFTDASGNEAQATVVSISGLRGYNNEAANNGIKTLTVKADLPSLNTTFVYWNDLETVNILGNVESLVRQCVGPQIQQQRALLPERLRDEESRLQIAPHAVGQAQCETGHGRAGDGEKSVHRCHSERLLLRRGGLGRKSGHRFGRQRDDVPPERDLRAGRDRNVPLESGGLARTGGDKYLVPGCAGERLLLQGGTVGR